MNTRRAFLLVAVNLAWLLICAAAACAYPVGPAESLEKLTAEADIIFKGTAISGGPAQDEWFEPYAGFVARETQFKVISIIKGERPGDTLRFRHYDQDPKRRILMFQPQCYHFEIGRTYIVFAKRSGPVGAFRQLWKHHKVKEDQGVLLCVDDKPVDAREVNKVLWAELQGMLASVRVPDVVYAIGQLDQMSKGGRGFDRLSDFDRMDVLAAVRGLLTHRDSRIVQRAIGLVGTHNPYLSDERTLFWLATIGSAEVHRVGKMDPKMKNVGGELYWKDLVALADSRIPDETRAMAIRALGLVREPSLEKRIERWLADSVPAVRASAALLLADFPGPKTCRTLTALAGDGTPEVRACVARAAGFAQQTAMAGVLARLLADREPKVRRAAAMSLLSFSPRNEAIAEVFRANLTNEEFKPLFLLALAREKPADHLDALAKTVEEKTEPKDFWGGQIPAFTAWEILFAYLRAQPFDKIRSGELDRYLDAMEKVGQYSSSEPRDIYAFYVQRGMTERAKIFRGHAKKAASYDLDYYFRQVDGNPSLYKRE
jgi:HEAT repeat protein